MKKDSQNEDAFKLDDDIQLVPDRWSETGWKYVTGDPNDKIYFN